eukprot:UN08197
MYRLLDAIQPFYEQINNYDDGCNAYVENYCYALLSMIELTLKISDLDKSFIEILKTYFWAKTLPKSSMFWDDDGHLVRCYILFNVRLRESLLKIVLESHQKVPSGHICCAQFEEIRENSTCSNKLFKQAKTTKPKVNEADAMHYSPTFNGMKRAVTSYVCDKMETDLKRHGTHY